MNYRLFYLLSAFWVCVVLAIIVNLLYGIDIVYTHLFYIPIILTGIWYPRYALFLAAALGLIHIACDYATADAFRIGALLRAVLFMTGEAAFKAPKSNFRDQRIERYDPQLIGV